MNNLIVKLILIGACIGLGLGVVGNLAGKNTLDYKAQYNFPGADDNRINKNLDENPRISSDREFMNILFFVSFEWFPVITGVQEIFLEIQNTIINSITEIFVILCVLFNFFFENISEEKMHGEKKL